VDALATTEASLRDAENRLVAARAELSSVRGSTSWRLTGPLRSFADWISASRVAEIRVATRRAFQFGRSSRSVVDVAVPAPDPLASAAVSNADMWCTQAGPIVSVVITNFGADPSILPCVQCVLAYTAGIPYEVIIVDRSNDGQDLSGLGEIGDRLRTIKIGPDRFLGEANNIGVEAARGEFVCLLSNDVRVGEGWLTALYAAMRNDPMLAAVAPRLLREDGTDAADNPAYRNLLQRIRGRDESDNSHLGDAAYASSVAVLLDLQAFLSVGGFDLTYEPGYLGDLDLCLKFRLVDRSIRVCPEVRVVRLEQTDDGRAEAASQRAVAEVNTGKLIDRWESWLNDPSPQLVEALCREVIPVEVPGVSTRGAMPEAVIFTPYMLTPGGGERFIMTLAAVLSRTHAVEIATPHRYSRMRVAKLAQEFSLDLSLCTLTTLEETRLAPRPELWITLGNHIFPSVGAAGKHNWYICQFPFPMDAATAAASRGNLSGYDVILAYSDYARNHVNTALISEDVPTIPTEVVYPPVPRAAGTALAKRPIVLSVGRFISSGHSKRHDALIDAFRVLFHRCGGSIEFHIVGSSFPTPGDMEYLAELKASAADIPVTFHVNAKKHTLEVLYRDAMFYWHATGYGLRPPQAPECAEHFGISIVEAMSAGCVALAFAYGGPCEIIRNGETGFLFTSLDELVDQTAVLLRPSGVDERVRIGTAAAEAADRFSLGAFDARIETLVAAHLSGVVGRS
jgi:glycosyltransferase involved in cell wall biosynthesis/GT2 family glycosyltransferase